MILKIILFCMFSCVIVSFASIDPPDFAPLTTAGDEQQLQTIQYTAYCKDQNHQCPGWAKRGECTFNPIWMSLNCQESCKICHDGDKNFYCGYWARSGECTRNPEFMNIACAPSCSKYASSKRSSDNRVQKIFSDAINRKPEQLNYSKDFAPLEADTANDEKPWTHPRSVEVIVYCKDQNSKCAEWAKQGLCTQNSIYMILNCQDSCNLCHDGDKELHCWHEAKYRDICINQAKWMMENCVGSCYRYGKCVKSGDDKVEETFNDVINRKPEQRSFSEDAPDFTSLDVATASNDQPCKPPKVVRFSAICKDQHSYCSKWAKWGECEKHPVYMNLNCQEACKVCHGGDKNIYCGYLARRGDCTNYRDWMMNNCSASCLIYKTFAIQSKNYNTYYVGMKNGNEAWIIEDASQNSVDVFEEVQGLVYQNPVNTTAEGKIVSFRRNNNFYLRQKAYKLYFHQPPVNDPAALQQFNRDASFVMTRDGSYFRLESENHRGYFVRHDAFRLWLERIQGQISKDDRTFKKIFLN